MEKIITSLRQLIIDHLAATQPLLVDVSIGTTTVLVANACRFKVGEEVLVLSLVTGEADDSFPKITAIGSYKSPAQLLAQYGITSPVGGYPITITPGLNSAWTVIGESVSIIKAIGHKPLKRVHIGDLKVIPDFPTITVTPKDEDNDWMTLRATTHEYRVGIKIFTLADNFEESEILLMKLTRSLRELLIENIHPIIDGKYFSLTADLMANGTVVSIPDTSSFRVGQTIAIRSADIRPSQPIDDYSIGQAIPISEENVVRTILSPTELQLVSPAQFNYFASRQAQVIQINSYLYDCRASSASYGYVPGTGGSFLRASEISWYGKECIFREGNLIT